MMSDWFISGEQSGGRQSSELKDGSGKNTINLAELEQSLSCPLTPRMTQSV